MAFNSSLLIANGSLQTLNILVAIDSNTSADGLFDATGDYKMSSFVMACLIMVIAVTGLLSNGISAHIFSRPEMRSSINIYLYGLSCIDFAVVLFAIPTFGISGLNSYLKIDLLRKFVVYAVHSTYPLAMMAQSSSVWIFVAITVERFVVVCFPLAAKQLCTVRRARISLSVILIVGVLYNVIRFWEFEIDYSSGTPQITSHIRANQNYFYGYYVGLYVATHFLIPFTILMLLNGYMAFTIRQANVKRMEMTMRQRNEHKTTLMMIVIICIFLLTNTIPFVLNIIEGAHQKFFDDFQTLHLAFFLLDFGNLLVIVNSSSTFIVYYKFSQKYRKCFKQLVYRRSISIESGENSQADRKSLSTFLYRYSDAASPLEKRSILALNGKKFSTNSSNNSATAPQYGFQLTADRTLRINFNRKWLPANRRYSDYV